MDNDINTKRLKQNIAIMINNTIRIIAFVILAIVFNHWWISLLSILFLISNGE